MQKYVLVTGVSTGIGYETARLLVSKNIHVFGSVRSLSDAEKLESEFGSKFTPLIFDVTDLSAIQNAVPIAKEKMGDGALIAIVNNAGIAINGPLLHIDMKLVEHQLNVNIIGVLHVIQQFFPLMDDPSQYHLNKRIINIGSISGLFAMPFLGPYCISKFALEALTDSLRRECLIYPNIDVVVLEPGPFDTPIWEKANHHQEAYQNPRYQGFLSFKEKTIRSKKESALHPKHLAKEIHQMIVRKRVPTRKVIGANRWFFKMIRDWIPDRRMDRRIMKAYKNIKTGKTG